MGDGNPGRTLPKVVVLDDNQSTLTLAKGRLETRGMDVTPILVDGSESLEKIADRIVCANPELVLSDLEMGSYSGLQVRDAMAQIDKDLPFVINSTTPQKVPDAARVITGKFGNLNAAYDKQDTGLFNDIAKFLNAKTPERSL